MARKSKVHDPVCELLEANRRSKISNTTPRDSDGELIVQFLQLHMGAELTAAQCAIIRSVNFESIRRTRAKLQEQGKYWGSPEVMRARRIKGYEVQQTAPGASAQEIGARIEDNSNA